MRRGALSALAFLFVLVLGFVVAVNAWDRLVMETRSELVGVGS
jgi:hypothetical protein